MIGALYWNSRPVKKPRPIEVENAFDNLPHLDTLKLALMSDPSPRLHRSSQRASGLKLRSTEPPFHHLRLHNLVYIPSSHHDRCLLSHCATAPSSGSELQAQ